MQGKLVFNHSRSTFLLVKRLNIDPLWRRGAHCCKWKKGRGPARPWCLLFREGEIGLACAGDVNRLALLFHAFMPCDHVVFAIGDVLDFVVPARSEEHTSELQSLRH